jgi:hypothetical protein
MDALVLGNRPQDLTVVIVPGAKWTATIQSQDEATGEPVPWPDGSVMRLELEDGEAFTQSWSATFEGSLAKLTISQVEVNALPTLSLRAQLWLDYGTGEFLWASGSVVAHD